MQWDAGRGPDEKDGLEKFSPHLWFPGGGLQSTCFKVFHDIVHNMDTGGIRYHHETVFETCIQSGDLLLETNDVVLIY